jgi:hypothetical protein
LRLRSFAALIFAAGMTAAAAQDMKGPRITRAHVDWDIVAAAVNASEGWTPGADALAHLNAAAAEVFPNIAASPVPVLLPFNTADMLRDRAAGNSSHPTHSYLIGLSAPPFFQAGPGGYDAAFSTYAKDLPGLGISFSERIDIHMSGSSLVYELDEPIGMIGWPVNGLEADFPGIKRLYVDGYVRYTFVRYGVPYVASIDCFDGGSRYRKISCRDADKVASRFLKSLQVAGGAPQPQAGPVAAKTIDRPQEASTVFTYHSPGDLIAGTGTKGNRGRADYTVYSKIRFPLADAPAFANSQAFMNWGNCDSTGRVSLGRNGNTAAYRCRVNGMPLVQDESANYAYPWRDNFCEHRFFFVGECPAGLGHQGQDIRPANCKQRIEGANRCEPYLHDVVAVRDGMLLRARGQFAFYVVVNAADERVRFRYLHLLPKQLDEDNVLSGRAVHEGEVLGKVGNFFRRERGTTYHLHFDIQVPTRHGWVFVNPYMTLVAAYERLIQGRGKELKDQEPKEEAPATTASVPLSVAPAVGTAPAMPRAPAAGLPATQPPAPAPPIAAVNPIEMDVLSETKRIISEPAPHDRPDRVDP